MAKNKTSKSTPFALALAARRGDVPPESLVGAARHLYKDPTLTQESLQDYAKGSKRSSTKQGLGRRHSTFKRG